MADGINEQVSELLKAEERLAQYAGPDRVIHHTEFPREEQQKEHFYSGIGELDAEVEGFQRGELVTISGYTGQGKTTLADTLAKRFMDTGNPVLFFSFEVQMTAFLEKYRESKASPLYIPLTLETMNLPWIRDRVLEAKAKHGCEVVVIDHLHFIVDMAFRQNMSLNIGACMRYLKKEVASMLNVLVILLAHTAQPTDNGEELHLGKIRDSSFIAQESDMVLMIMRLADRPPGNQKLIAPSFSQNRSRLMIEKARRTGAFKKRITLVKRGHWFEEELPT